MVDPGDFFSGDGVAAEKARAIAKLILGRAADDGFRATSIGDESVRAGGSGDDRQGFDGCRNRQSDIDQVSAANGAGEIACAFVDGAPRKRVLEDVGTIESDDGYLRKLAVKREDK